MGAIGGWTKGTWGLFAEGYSREDVLRELSRATNLPGLARLPQMNLLRSGKESGQPHAVYRLEFNQVVRFTWAINRTKGKSHWRRVDWHFGNLKKCLHGLEAARKQSQENIFVELSRPDKRIPNRAPGIAKHRKVIRKYEALTRVMGGHLYSELFNGRSRVPALGTANIKDALHLLRLEKVLNAHPYDTHLGRPKDAETETNRQTAKRMFAEMGNKPRTTKLEEIGAVLHKGPDTIKGYLRS